MDHEEYIDAKESVLDVFEEFFENRGLFRTLGAAYTEFEDYIERGTFTSEKVYYLFIMENFLEKTNRMHVNNKIYTTKVIQAVLDSPEKLELEEEDKADLIALALKLKPTVENIQTHSLNNRA